MKKKILYVITKSNWGGAQRYVYDLATNLPRDQFEVQVALGGSGALKQKLDEAGIPTYVIPGMQRDVVFFKEISAFVGLFKLFVQRRPDIVHLNSSKAAAIGTLAARVCGIKKIIFTVHGWPFKEKRNLLARALIWNVSWLTALLSHHVICVSDADARAAKRMPFVDQRVLRIYNGIDLAMPFGSGERIRAAFPPTVSITGTIGELTKNKNQRALIEEARRTPGMYVAIVGEGVDRTSLGQKITEYGLEDRVKLFGFIPAQDALRGFDTFALPSRKEGLPYVLLEARLAGIPIIANRVGGVGEILDAKDMHEFSLTHMVEKTIALY